MAGSPLDPAKTGRPTFDVGPSSDLGLPLKVRRAVRVAVGGHDVIHMSQTALGRLGTGQIPDTSLMTGSLEMIHRRRRGELTRRISTGGETVRRHA